MLGEGESSGEPERLVIGETDPKMTLEKWWQARKCLATGVEEET